MNKPRPPKVNEENLKQAKSQTSQITTLKSRFELLEEHRKEGLLPTSYIAFDALSALFGGLKEGYTYEELHKAWPSDWGKEEMIVPSALVAVLYNGWTEYIASDCKQSLGEVFDLGGGTQGKKKVRDILKTADVNRKLSREVDALYMASGITSEPISIEKAYASIAEKHCLSEDKVRKAHNKFNKKVRKKLNESKII